MNPLIQSWLLQSFILFLIVGSVAGLAVGALLLLRPQSLQWASQTLNRWISTRHLDQRLERKVNLDSWFYRYRRPASTLTLLGALYILYFFALRMNKQGAIGGLASYFKLPPPMISWLMDALVLSAMVGALFAAVVSVFLLLRPSLLRDFEQGANRWISLRRALKPVEITHRGVDAYVFEHRRQAGVLLVVGSLYVLVLLLSPFGH